MSTFISKPLVGRLDSLCLCFADMCTDFNNYTWYCSVYSEISPLFYLLGLRYPKGEKATLKGFTDADYAGDVDNRFSTKAYLFTTGKIP